MAGPPDELMTREKKIFFRELHQMAPTYGHVTKLYLESEFQHKGDKQTKKKVWTNLSSLGQEPAFNLFWPNYFNQIGHVCL